VDGMAYRASDRDRERVEHLLRTAFDDGRLTLVEFDHRLEQVHQAVTYRDLEALVLDLPYDHSFLRLFCQPPHPANQVELQPSPSGVRVLRVVGLVFVTLLGLSLIPSSPVIAGVMFAILAARLLTGPRRRRRTT